MHVNRIGAYGIGNIMYGDEHIPQVSITTNLSAELESKDLDFGAPQHAKYIDGILLEYNSTHQLDVSFGYRDRLNDALSWTQPFPVIGNDLTHCRIPEARYYRIKVRDSRPSHAWAFTAMQLYGRALGVRRRA